MTNNVDMNNQENVENRLLKVIEETFTRLELDENLYKLKEKYKKKKNKETVKQDNSIFAKGYKDPILLSEYLKQIYKENDWDEKLQYSKIIADWEKIVGSNITNHAQIEKIENKTLYLRTTSTNWAIQLGMLKAEIQRNINMKIGYNLINKIVIIPPSKPSWKKGKYHISGRGPRDTYG